MVPYRKEIWQDSVSYFSLHGRTDRHGYFSLVRTDHIALRTISIFEKPHMTFIPTTTPLSDDDQARVDREVAHIIDDISHQGMGVESLHRKHHNAVHPCLRESRGAHRHDERIHHYPGAPHRSQHLP